MAFIGVTIAHGPSTEPTACRSPSYSFTIITGSTTYKFVKVQMQTHLGFQLTHTHTPINLATIYLWLRNLLCVNVTAKNGFAVLVPAAWTATAWRGRTARPGTTITNLILLSEDTGNEIKTPKYDVAFKHWRKAQVSLHSVWSEWSLKGLKFR